LGLYNSEEVESERIDVPRPVRIILIVLVLAAAGFGLREFWNERNHADPDVIRISGNIEVVDAGISFKIGGWVTERLVDEGELVEKGQVIARLENRDLKQEIAIRKAEVKEAKAVLAELLAGSRPEEIKESKAALEKARSDLNELLAGSRPEEIAAARADVEEARARMENLKVEMKRYQRLYEDGVAPQEKFDQALTDYDMAVAQWNRLKEQLRLAVEGPRREDIDQARSALEEAKERYQLVKKGPRVERIDRARAQYEKSRAALQLAGTRLEYTEVVSPLTGVVLSKNIEPGEYVSPGTPVVTVGDLVNVWVRGYINETDLGRVKVGMKARVLTDTYPDKPYTGRVSFISSEAEFTPKNVQTKKERVKLVYRVKVDVRNPEMELKPGMPVDVDILLSEAAV